MPSRVRHALRFGVTTLVAVYLIGVAWELVDVYARDEVPQGWTAARTFWFNELEWRWLAGGEALAVFLLRLSDVHGDPPSWLFAWASGLWLGLSSVAVTQAMLAERWGLAAVLALGAAAIWFLLHQRIPGFPGHSAVAAGDAQAALFSGGGAASGEQELR
ncbi:MAG TPA: hypothetical protein VKA84_01105 [Gemmatimonadaceae bacterium]|nr:hypothetical protein [Gemmatimonadaceae bacterium]